MNKVSIFFFLLLILSKAFGQIGIKTQVNIPAVTKAITCVEDFNGDQQKDFLISGFDGQAFTHRIYKNGGEEFTTNNYFNIEAQGMALSAHALDYDNNGSLEVLMCIKNKEVATLGIFEYKASAFKKIVTVFDAYTFDSLVAFPVDYNHDLFTDIVVFGVNGNTNFSFLFENRDGLTFLEHKLPLGDNPLLNVSISKSNNNNQPIILWSDGVANGSKTLMYEVSEDGQLKNTSAKLPAIVGKTVMMDADADNDLDIYVNGLVNGKSFHGFLANSNNDFSTPKLQLPLVGQPDIVFHDLNGDGLQDAILGGVFPNDSSLVKVFSNTVNGWSVGKTVLAVDSPHITIANFNETNTSKVLVMGIENGNKYTFSNWTLAPKNHTLDLTNPPTVLVNDNTAIIKWKKASISLSKNNIGYDFRIFKDSKLISDFRSPSLFSDKTIQNDSVAINLVQGNYKLEMRAFDGSGKTSTTKDITFTINKFRAAMLFDVVPISGMQQWALGSNSKILDINQDGMQDIFGVTKNGLAVPLIQSLPNYFVPQNSIPASGVDVSASHTASFNSYILDKGILYKYDFATRVTRTTGIADVNSYNVLDIDNDGDDDVYAFSSKEFRGIIYLYKEGEFQRSNLEIIDKRKLPWKVADMNNDGYLDIITKSDSANDRKHYIGWNIKGDSIRWEKLSLNNNELTDILDFDNNGKLDFVAYNHYDASHLIYYYKNNSLIPLDLGVVMPIDQLPDEDIKIVNIDNDPEKELVYLKNDVLYVLKYVSNHYELNSSQALGFDYRLNEIGIRPYFELADFNNDKRTDIFVQYIIKDEYQTLVLYNKGSLDATPTAPGNLKCNTTLATSTFSWSPVPKASSYKIELWTNKEKVINAGVINIGTGFTNTLPNTGLLYDTIYHLSKLPSDTYYWKVYALNGSLVSGPSDTKSFNTSSFVAKTIASINDTARYGDFGGQQFSHPCDFDNDGDLDFLFLATGRDTVVGSMNFIGGNHIFINNGDGSFKTKKVNIADLYSCDVAFFDFNKDGYQDIALTAVGLHMANTHWESKPIVNNGVGNFFSKIYLNDKKNNFYDSKITLPDLGMGNIDVADYNQDGHHDLLISGRGAIATMGETPIWSAVLATYSEELEGFRIDTLYKNSTYNIYSQFQDTDVDGDYDIFLLGKSTSANKVTQIIVNKGGSFYENKTLNRQTTTINGYDINYFDFGDYDRDGDQDLAIFGINFINFTPTLADKYYHTEEKKPLPNAWDVKIYSNLGNNLFAPSGLSIDASLPQSRLRKLKWLDYDNDGNLEIMTQFNHQTLMIVQKTDGNFKLSEQGQITDSSTYSTYGDFNKDSKIDFVIGGKRSAFKCYLSNIENTNIPPAVVSKLAAKVVDNVVNLQWEGSADDRTNTRSLKYAVELYNEKGLVYSNANFKTIPTEDFDNYCYSTKRVFRNLKDGTYYWRVAAIDDNYNISNFSKPDSFKIALRPVIAGFSNVCNFDVVKYTVLPTQPSQACANSNLPCPRYKWVVQTGAGTVSYLDSTYSQVAIRWGLAGKHLVKVTNPVYKIDTTLEVNVKFNPIPRIDYVFVGDSIGNRTLQFKDSLRSFVSKYEWKFGESDDAKDTTANPIFTFPETGVYPVTLTVQYNNLCTNTYKKSIELRNPKIDGKRNVCRGESATYKVGPKNFKYNWKVENGTIVSRDSSTLAITVAWNNLGGGSVIVTSNTGIATLSDSLYIMVNEVPMGQITIPDALGTNALIQFSDSISGDHSQIKYNWSFGELNKRYDYSSPRVVFEQSGPHLISFNATNKYGCSLTIEETVQVTENLVPIEISNLLTQNDDGYNDYLFVKNIDRFPDSEVLFYSPWGKLIFSAAAYQNNWKPGSDGVELMPKGNYLCIVKIKSMGKEFEQIITVLE
ncbi:MAG TPA: FG-GAP-like repeat-containing protein [Cytophagaceae bacterium]|jgi:gliding motility-associated-like protein